MKPENFISHIQVQHLKLLSNMEKKLSERDLTMIIYARKYLDDAKRSLAYTDDERVEIFKCMEWLTELKVRLAK